MFPAGRQRNCACCSPAESGIEKSGILLKRAIHMIRMKKIERPADVTAVSQLARTIWNEYYTPFIGKAQVNYMLAKFQCNNAIARQIACGYEYYLVMNGRQRAGYFAIIPHPSSSTAQLSKIYVRRALRGRGIGKAIMKFAERRCIESGIRKLRLTVNRNNADSIAFYRSAGFAVTGRIVRPIGKGFVMDDYRMTKTIARLSRPACRTVKVLKRPPPKSR